MVSLEWGVRAADFDYALPEELIAQRPLPERSASRMLVIDRRSETWTDARFLDLPGRLGRGDCVVVNDSRVLAARLVGQRVAPATGLPGGRAELLVLGPDAGGSGRWRALVRPGRRLAEGTAIDFGGQRALVLERIGGGVRLVSFPELDDSSVRDLLARQGHVPLPPYIRRDDDTGDRERYQTVFAAADGSVAAPTAGLHFDERMVQELRRGGARLARITLHVGLGTFRPVRAEWVEDHVMDAESFEVPPDAAEAIGSARRTVAVGTTVVRALESAASSVDRAVLPLRGRTSLFIAPGHRFRAVQGLLTNFHLPRSTLLMLVAAFAGTELVLEAYAHAVRERYRFYSYGDCMLIL